LSVVGSKSKIEYLKLKIKEDLFPLISLREGG